MIILVAFGYSGGTSSLQRRVVLMAGGHFYVLLTLRESNFFTRKHSSLVGLQPSFFQNKKGVKRSKKFTTFNPFNAILYNKHAMLPHFVSILELWFLELVSFHICTSV
jgi:hypothetical protein